MSTINLLKDRKIIIIRGDDQYRFLQDIISNNIDKIDDDLAIYSCFLTPQGKYLADFFIAKMDDGSIIIDLPEMAKDLVINKFTLYKLRSKIEILDKSNEYLIYSVQDKDFSDYPSGSIVKLEGALAFVDPRLQKLGVRAFVSQNHKSLIEEAYIDHSNYYDKLRIDYLVPEGHKDMIPEKSFPLEYGIDKFNGIDFKKGCYVGQELVSRTHYRGTIRKKIYKITAQQSLPETGSEIIANDNKIGTICSTFAKSGLALLRIQEFEDAEKESCEFYAGGILIEISSS